MIDMTKKYRCRDGKLYTPVSTFEVKHGRMPTVSELADYIVELRLIEADKLIAALNDAS